MQALATRSAPPIARTRKTQSQSTAPRARTTRSPKSATVPSARLEARIALDILDTAKRAAEVQGQTLTDFVVFAVSNAAQEVLLDQLFFSVDEEKFNAFEAALAAPLASNIAIKNLLSSRSPWEK